MGGLSGTTGTRFVDTKCRRWKGPSYSLEIGNTTTPDLEKKTDKNCQNWVVLTTINPPTKTVQKLHKMGRKWLKKRLDIYPFPLILPFKCSIFNFKQRLFSINMKTKVVQHVQSE